MGRTSDAKENLLEVALKASVLAILAVRPAVAA
jgi:hypothetical protein